MTELRFHRDVYAGTALDSAMTVFAGFAAFERAEEAQHWVVRVSAPSAGREKLVAAELGNYALGLTVRERGRR